MDMDILFWNLCPSYLAHIQILPASLKPTNLSISFMSKISLTHDLAEDKIPLSSVAVNM